MKLVIQKFGGTSMGNSEAITQCAKIVADQAKKGQVVAVVSAMSGVTDKLLDMTEMARKQKPKLIAATLNELETRHKKTLAAFIDKDKSDEIWEEEFARSFKKLRTILIGISYVGDLSEKSTAMVASYGERLSSRIMKYALIKEGLKSERFNTVRLVRTDSNYLSAEVDLKRTKICHRRVLTPFLSKGIVPVLTGFIGKDTHGDLTLLGRGGTDYTASLAGICLGASRVDIWTDVDGVMSTDPRKVKHVCLWDKIDMATISEMAHSGAKVLHPKTISAAVEKGIPVWVKNTFNTAASGTEVIMEDKTPGVRGITVSKNQLIVHLQEPGMLAGVGFIRKVAEIFEKYRIPMDVCTTSEVTFSVSLDSKKYNPRIIKELKKIAHSVKVINKLAKICVIGVDIGCDGEILDRVITALKKNRVYSVSNGASFSNITVLIDETEADEALLKLHTAIFKSS